jgi:hypothetical protein
MDILELNLDTMTKLSDTLRQKGGEVMSTPKLTYTIEETGLGGWMSYRYQYNLGAVDRFGYAETREEAEQAIKEAK